MYFEINDVTGQLQQTQTKFFESEIKCMDLPEVPEGRTRYKFLAVGFNDNTCRILSLDVDSCLQKLSIQAFPAQPESVCLTNHDYLHVGLANGVLIRSTVDSITGGITDSR